MSPQRAGSPAWWTTKGRQVRTHLRARVEPAERAGLEAWVPAALLTVFDAMPVADRRHGLDVVASLRVAGGGGDHELLLAGLLHDCGKSTADGRGVGLGPRVAWSLGEALGPGVLGMARRLPGYGPALDQLAEHAERSATMVGVAGGSIRTVDLIRDQAALPADRAGELLRRADEAN